MQPLKDVKALNRGAVVFASRSSGLRLGLGSGTLVFQGGVVDEQAERRARKRIEQIERELAELPAIEDRDERAEIARELTNERAGCLTQLDRELGVAIVPKSGAVHLDRGLTAPAEYVLVQARGHRLYEDGPTDSETFWEVTA